MEKSEIKSPDLKAARSDRMPIKISITNTPSGILDLQYRHLPLKNKKEKRGTRSLLRKTVEQEKQNDLPFHGDNPVLNLSAITLIKLPKAAPKRKIINPKTYSIHKIIARFRYRSYRFPQHTLPKAAFDMF